MKKKTLEEEVAQIKQRMNIVSEEKKNHKYEYGCAMLYFDLPDIKKIHEIIDPKDVYSEEGYGLETEPHVTLLFGLHDGVSVPQVTEVMDKFKYTDCILYNASLFKNPQYDVLKFDIRYPTKGGAFLHKTNAELSKFPHTTDYPDYHPHCTIGYLKSGTGEKYVKELNDREFVVTPEYGVYTTTNGDKNRIKIN